ncbi:MAG: cysteine desulfurase-like protein, partial [Cyanobacteria bacterium P01_G01_bin.38]
AIGRDLRPGDEILVTCLDHDANVAPWQALAEQGAVVQTVDIHPEDCTLDMSDFARKLSPRTRLVAVTYASNAVGTLNDLPTIIQQAHAMGAWVFVDAVHYAVHAPIDVKALDCDFLACSPYKFFGPHLGIIYGKRDLLGRLHPYKVRPASNQSPDRWETGTQNHEGLAGLVASIEYLANLGQRLSSGILNRRSALITAMTATHHHGQFLGKQLLAGLLNIPQLTVYGITDPKQLAWRVPTVSLRLAGYPPVVLAKKLADRGLFAWHGNFYALNLTERLGVEEKGGLLRVGLVHYNTANEVDRLLGVLQELATASSTPV